MFGSDSQSQEIDYEQQASFSDPSAYLNASRLKELQNLALWELNPQDVLDQLEHYYKGEAFDVKEQKWVKKFSGYLNDESAAKLINFLSSYVNKINFLNDYEEKEISHRAWQARIAVANWLRFNYKKEKIDKRNFDLILLPTDAIIFASYKKSLRGGERRFLGTVHNTQENTAKTQPLKKGITSIFR